MLFFKKPKKNLSLIFSLYQNKQKTFKIWSFFYWNLNIFSLTFIWKHQISNVRFGFSFSQLSLYNPSLDESQYSEGGWIQWFCSLEDHNFFCEVDEEYIRDNFNLYGLRQKFTHYKSSNEYRVITYLLNSEALEMILSPECPDDEDLEDEK